MRDRRIRIVLICLFALFCVTIILRQVVTWQQRQWDFKTFYYASKAYQAGLSPYDVVNLSRVAGHTISYDYVYPPLSVYLFWPFTLLRYEAAHFAFLAIKCLLLVYLLSLWARKFLPDVAAPLFLIYCVLAFNRALQVDVWTGNVSTFEQCLIWTGLYCYMKGRLGWFCAAICLAASWKLLPAAFLALVLFSDNRRKWLYFGVSATACAGLQGLTAIAMPGLFRSFVSNAARLDERGVVNPSTLAFVRDMLDRIGVGGHSILAAASYGAIVLAVVIVSWKAYSGIREWEPSRRRNLLVLLFCLVYALAAPRLKDYSYILLIPAGYWVISRPMLARYFWPMLLALVLPVAPLAKMAGAPEVLYGYYALLQAFAVWALYVVYMLRLPAASDNNSECVALSRATCGDPNEDTPHHQLCFA